MIRKHKIKLIISSILILMPMLFGIIFWDELPEILTIHWGVDGNPDGQSGKAFAVFALPIILLALHWICMLITAKDPKNENQNKKAFRLIFWIIPMISWFACGITYTATFKGPLDPMTFLPLMVGIMFIVIGNYMPKCKQNSTLGIKIKSTLESEENWNATHRFAGKLWVLGGIVLLFVSFLKSTLALILSFSITLAIVITTFVYSLNYRKKQLKSDKNDIIPREKTKTEKVAIVFVIIILTVIAVIMFIGDVETELSENALTVDSVFWNELTVEYSAIDSIEFRESIEKGIRKNGFNSAKLALGVFNNDEFGDYVIYSYTGCDSAVIIKSGDKTLAVGMEDFENTKAFYESLKTKIEG